jgi:dienelactone hydrolase
VVFGKIQVWLPAFARALLMAGALFAGSAHADLDPEFFGPRLISEDVQIAAPGGYELAATILRPVGRGPFGAVVLNHGVAGSDEERARESSDIFMATASVFARRGYVVVMPLRRGFGATGGAMAEDAGPCRNPDYMRAEQAAADDVMAAYDYARRLPYVDGSRMILAGQSGGAMVALFTAGMRQPEGLRAVLSFAGGRGGNPERRPGVPCAVEAVARVFDVLGKRVRVPVLLNYAENDQYFNVDTTRGWYKRFSAGGAPAEYVLQPAFGNDGHYLFSDVVGVRHWLPTVERFLSAHGVPFERLDSGDPAGQPLLAVTKLPNVKSDSCHNLYRAFLESPGPRAYAVSGDGHCGFAGGVRNANEKAVRQCQKASGGSCALYAVDGEVVWKQPATPEVMQASVKPSATASTGATENKLETK